MLAAVSVLSLVCHARAGRRSRRTSHQHAQPTGHCNHCMMAGSQQPPAPFCLALLFAVPVPGHWWNITLSAPVVCPVASYCLGGSRAAAPLACGGNMTSGAGSTTETDCVPLPGYFGAPAQLSPADHYSAGGSRTEQPMACGANLWSLAGSAAITDCGRIGFCIACLHMLAYA